MNDVVILSGVRTAIGDFGGSLKDVAPWELGRTVIAEAIKRADMAPADVGHVVLGQVIPSEPRDAYLSRICAIAAGIPDKTPALDARADPQSAVRIERSRRSTNWSALENARSVQGALQTGARWRTLGP